MAQGNGKAKMKGKKCMELLSFVVEEMVPIWYSHPFLFQTPF